MTPIRRMSRELLQSKLYIESNRNPPPLPQELTETFCTLIARIVLMHKNPTV